MIRIQAFIEQFPIRGAFVIARERRTVQTVMRVEIHCDGVVGQGEAVPYKRYGETPELVMAQVQGVRAHDMATLERAIAALPAGAARNALDCALWDVRSKLSGKPVWQLLHLPEPKPVVTAFTISLDSPEAMAAKAREVAGQYTLLKLKLGGAGDDARMAAVRAAAPDAILIADANESWTEDLLKPLMAAAGQAGIALIEQPLPAGHDEALADIPHLIPICADESLHTRADLSRLKGKYEAVNIKLDKAGGLTEAVALLADAQAQGFQIMIGCMLATSLAMAPAFLLAQTADYVDLDGPLLLERDRENGLRFDGARIFPLKSSLWGI